MHPTAKTNHTLAVITLFLWTFGIRAALLGQAPFADEGHYAAASYFQFLGYTKGIFAEDSIIPKYGTIELYSLLFSWVNFLPVNSYLSLRVVDGAIASLAAVMLFNYLETASKQTLPAFLAAFLLTTAINHPLFIEAGARNPIPAATLLLFSALHYIEQDRMKNELLPAILLGSAVLLREQFIAVAAIVTLYILHQYGARKAAVFSLYAIAFSIAAFISFSLLKGGITGVAANIEGYRGTANLAPSNNLDLSGRIALAWHQAAAISTAIAFILPVVLLGILAPLLAPPFRKRQALAPYLLGAGLSLATLVEVLIKKPYPYHLAQLLIGLGIFACYGFQLLITWLNKMRERWPRAAWLGGSTIALVHILLFSDFIQVMRHGVGWSMHFAPVMIYNDWNSPAVKDSYYLSIASIVKKESTTGDTILSSSYNIFPLTNLQPPARKNASLGIFRLLVGPSAANYAIADLITNSRPTVFIEEGGELQRLRQIDDPIDTAIAKVYHPATTTIGPGLFPYRKFTARIHVLATQN